MPYKRGTKYIGQIRRNRKRIEKVCETKKEALAWEAEMRKMPDGEWTEKTNIVYLADWAQAYLNYAKEIFSDKTYEEKRSMFRRFFKYVPPTLPVVELTPAKVLGYLQTQKMARSGYAANKDRKNLIAAWNWGMVYLEPKVLPTPNPCRIKKMPEERHPRYVPPLEDFWRVCAVSQGQDRVMLLTFLHLAARRGEVFKLQKQDLDFDNKRVRIWTRKRKDGNFEADWLPMTNELREALLWWLDARPIKDEPYVFLCLDQTPFCEEDFGKPFKYRLHLMKRLCEKAGVKHFGFHSIRHLTATTLYQQGYSVATVQAILRHQSATTTTHYLKTLGVEDVRGAMEGLFHPMRSCEEAAQNL